tara:strand:- start:283 stop:477 length:195 start_codon:yes stop_codon:yes gene_type:complete
MNLKSTPDSHSNEFELGRAVVKPPSYKFVQVKKRERVGNLYPIQKANLSAAQIAAIERETAKLK